MIVTVLDFILLSCEISGYVLSNYVQVVVKFKMHASMLKYNISDVITNVWDTLQQDFECCAARSCSDWRDVFHSDVLPMSRCQSKTGAVGNATCNINSSTEYEIRCLAPFLNFAKAYAVLLGGIELDIAFISFIFDIILKESIRNSYVTV